MESWRRTISGLRGNVINLFSMPHRKKHPSCLNRVGAFPNIRSMSQQPFAAVYHPSDSFSTRYTSWKNVKQVMADFKKIYIVVTLDEAKDTLLRFGENGAAITSPA